MAKPTQPLTLLSPTPRQPGGRSVADRILFVALLVIAVAATVVLIAGGVLGADVGALFGLAPGPHLSLAGPPALPTA